jgi:hypothetical protein
MLIHGFANAGCSLKDMQKDVQTAFFDNTTIVVGYIQFSLNDIHMGILRANQPKPGVGFFGTTRHFSESLYPDKIALSRPSLDPIVHCCLSNLTSQSPRIVVYEGSRVHEQMREVATAFIREQITLTKSGLTLPNVFKDFSKDFGKTEAEKIAFVNNMMDYNSQQQLGSVLNKKGECGVTYLPKVKSFAWKHLPQVKQWDQQRDNRFEWTEAKQKAWRDKQGAITMPVTRTSSWEIARDTLGRSQLRRRTSLQGSVKDLLLVASVRSPLASPLSISPTSSRASLARTSSQASVNDSSLAASMRSPKIFRSISPTSSMSTEYSNIRSISPTSSLAQSTEVTEILSREKAPAASLGKQGMAEILANDRGWSGDQETPRRRSKSSSGKKSKKAAELVGAETESPSKKEPKAKKKKEGKGPKIKSYTKVTDFNDMIDVIEPLKSQPEEAGSEMIEAIEIATAPKQKKVKKKKENDDENEEGNVSNFPCSHRSRGVIPHRHRDCKVSDDVVESTHLNAHLFVPFPAFALYLQSSPLRRNPKNSLDGQVPIHQTHQSLWSNSKRPRGCSPVPCAPACSHVLSRASTHLKRVLACAATNWCKQVAQAWINTDAHTCRRAYIRTHVHTDACTI